MTPAKRISTLCAFLGALVIAAGIAFSFLSLDASPRMLLAPEAALERTEELMEAVAQGDYPLAGSYLLGQPVLAQAAPEKALEKQLWEAYLESLRYEFAGDLYADDQGLVRDVTVSFLDIPGVLEQLQGRISQVLAEEAASLDPQEVYDQEGGYQETFLSTALTKEINRILECGSFAAAKNLRLRLVSREGRWWVLPDQALLDILAGGMGK